MELPTITIMKSNLDTNLEKDYVKTKLHIINKPEDSDIYEFRMAI